LQAAQKTHTVNVDDTFVMGVEIVGMVLMMDHMQAG